MYLTTRRNYNNIFDEMFRSPFFSGNNDYSGTSRMMRTNVQENDKGFVLEMELPGFEKDDIQAELKDGYLTVTAKRSEVKDASDGDSKFIRKERFEGTCKRSFYVGDYLHQEDIKAAYTNGILKLEIPKEQEPVPEQPKLITID